MGIKQLSLSIILITLFTVAIIGFGVGFANDNAAAVSLSDDPEMVSMSDDLKVDASSYPDDYESTYQSIIDSSSEGETTPTGGSFAITPKTLTTSMGSIIKNGYVKVFGTGNGFGVFLTAFISVIGFLFAIYIWKAWIGRNPE